MLSIFSKFKRVQRRLCNSAGYATIMNSSGLWARNRSLPNDAHRPLEPSEIDAFMQIGLSKIDLDLMSRGWLSLSESNIADLATVVRDVRSGLGDRRTNAINIGLTFYPIFNAEAYVSKRFVLLHAPLIYGLDWLATFSVALASLRPVAQDEGGFDDQIAAIEKGASETLDVIAGLKRWGTLDMSNALYAYQGAQGPDLRYARLGYAIAASQRLWIVLHEFSHILSRDRQVGAKALEQEFAADLFATSKCEQIFTRRRAANSRTVSSAIPLLFDLFEALERRIPARSKTHPPARERRARVRAATPHWPEWGGGAENDLFRWL